MPQTSATSARQLVRGEFKVDHKSVPLLISDKKPTVAPTWQQYLAFALVAAVICASFAGWAVWRLGVTASVALNLPASSNIDGLNFGRGRDNLPLFTRQDVFGAYIETLGKVSNQRAFFDATVLPTLTPSLSEQAKTTAFNAFRRGLVITAPDRNSGIITAKYRSHSEQEADSLLSQYLDFTNQGVKKELLTEARNQIEHAAQLQKMALNRDNAFARESIQTELAEANRALAIARTIKLQDEPRDGTSAKDASALSGTLRYRRGEAALSAEVNTLTRILASPDAVRTGNTAALKDAILFYQDAYQMLNAANLKPSSLDTLTVNNRRSGIGYMVVLAGLGGALLGAYLAHLFYTRRRTADEQRSPAPSIQ